MSTRKVALFKSGVRLAMQEWGNPESPRKVLCLHGWLDNSNSFNNLAPILAEKGHHVVAYDNIGHGRSSHQSRTPPYAYPISPYVGRCRDVVEALGWKRFDIVGHSLGAFITTMFSGTYPEFVDNVALIDGFTPLSYPPSRAAQALRNAIEAERSYEAKGPLGPKPYATLRDAVEARMKSVQSYPGSQWLTFEAALAIVSRAVRPIPSDKKNPPTSSSEVKIKGLKTSVIETDPEPDITDLDFGPVAFRHDNKLLLPTNHPLTRDEVTAFVNGITARVLIVQGVNGWPHPESEYIEHRNILASKRLLTHTVLEGSHHLHLDPEHAPTTAQTIAEFFTKGHEKDGDWRFDQSSAKDKLRESRLQ